MQATPYVLGCLPCREKVEGEELKGTGMPHKNDLIIWLRMQPQQQQIYEVTLVLCAAGAATQ